MALGNKAQDIGYGYCMDEVICLSLYFGQMEIMFMQKYR